MSATTNWSQQGTQAVISLPAPKAARLFGLPFLAFGLYLLRMLVEGVLHPSEMTVAGWVLLPLITLAFLAPGWALVIFRRRVVIDAGARVAVDELDFLLYTKRTRSPLPAATHVMLRYELGSPGTDNTDAVYWTHVYIVADTPVLIGLFEQIDRAGADALAQQAARFLGAEIRDQRVEGGDVSAGGVVVERLGPDDVA